MLADSRMCKRLLKPSIMEMLPAANTRKCTDWKYKHFFLWIVHLQWWNENIWWHVTFYKETQGKLLMHFCVTFVTWGQKSILFWFSFLKLQSWQAKCKDGCSWETCEKRDAYVEDEQSSSYFLCLQSWK